MSIQSLTAIILQASVGTAGAGDIVVAVPPEVLSGDDSAADLTSKNDKEELTPTVNAVRVHEQLSYYSHLRHLSYVA